MRTAGSIDVAASRGSSTVYAKPRRDRGAVTYTPEPATYAPPRAHERQSSLHGLFHDPHERPHVKPGAAFEKR